MHRFGRNGRLPLPARYRLCRCVHGLSVLLHQRCTGANGQYSFLCRHPPISLLTLCIRDVAVGVVIRDRGSEFFRLRHIVRFPTESVSNQCRRAFTGNETIATISDLSCPTLNHHTDTTVFEMHRQQGVVLHGLFRGRIGAAKRNMTRET